MRDCSAPLLALPPALPAASAFALTADPEHRQLLRGKEVRITTGERLVYDFWRIVFDAGHTEYAPMDTAENYIQHDLDVANGRARS